MTRGNATSGLDLAVLGLSAFFHDSAAAITLNGKIVAAAQEERFTRKKHDRDFPINVIKYCLQQAGLTIEEIDLVVFYELPVEKFKRLLKTYLSFAPAGFQSYINAIPLWLSGKFFQKRYIAGQLNTLGVFNSACLSFTDHHLSHAASAFYASPYHEASILSSHAFVIAARIEQHVCQMAILLTASLNAYTTGGNLTIQASVYTFHKCCLKNPFLTGHALNPTR